MTQIHRVTYAGFRSVPFRIYQIVCTARLGYATLRLCYAIVLLRPLNPTLVLASRKRILKPEVNRVPLNSAHLSERLVVYDAFSWCTHLLRKLAISNIQQNEVSENPTRRRSCKLCLCRERGYVK
jgi:hypothetical protein